MKLLTTGAVCEILQPIGVTPKTFRTWCEGGGAQRGIEEDFPAVVPALGGGTQGKDRRFTFMQVVGIAVAAKVYRSEQGCHTSYVGKVVSAFGNTTEAELLRKFKTDGPCFVGPHHGRPVLRGPQYPEWVNVQEVYEAVKQFAEVREKAAACAGSMLGPED